MAWKLGLGVSGTVNKRLCEKGACLHKCSSSKGDRIKNLWEENKGDKFTLEELVLFCKRIHFAEPFINLNGNTLAAIALDATERLIPKTCSKTELENTICTIIAGTVQGKEEIILKKESDAQLAPEINHPI